MKSEEQFDQELDQILLQLDQGSSDMKQSAQKIRLARQISGVAGEIWGETYLALKIAEDNSRSNPTLQKRIHELADTVERVLNRYRH